MKAVVGMLALLGVGWVVFYYVGGYASFDPSDQYRKAKAAIGPGMTWEQVFQVTGDPRKYRIVNRHVERSGGEEHESFSPSAPVDFRRERVSAALSSNGLPHGFVCRFDYTTSEALQLTFDGTGTLIAIEDATTMADLLETKD